MSTTSKLAVALEMLESAQASIRSAKAVLSELAGVSPLSADSARQLGMPETTQQGKIIEGVFDGQNMIGPDKRTYPVPANYASKSKLVQGDILKLTITENGSFIYKQIGPIPRQVVPGTIAFEDGLYKIIAEGKVYRVLMASITFYKAEVGQRVSILLPEGLEAEWATIDNMLPDLPADQALEQAFPDGPPADDAPVEEAPAAPPARKRKSKAADAGA